MLNVRLPENLEKRFDKLAKETGRTKSYYVRKAMEQFIEDKEDYLLAVTRIEENNGSVSLEEAKRYLGLDD